MRSATMRTVAFRLARTIRGKIDASATRRFDRPWTRPLWSTTAFTSDGGTMRHVPEACCDVFTVFVIHASSAAPLARSEGEGVTRSRRNAVPYTHLRAHETP